jgi:hypothetical protein
LRVNGTKICLQIGYYEKLRDLQVAENKRKFQELGLPLLVTQLCSSQQQNNQTNEKDHGEGSDSSYLPGADEGQEDADGSDSNSVEKVTSHTWF